MSNLFPWFWSALSFLLAGLWLWTLLRQRRGAPTALPPAPEPTTRPVEAEDALKAAYALQEEEGIWGDEELARSVGLPEALAGEVARALVAFGWAEEDVQGGMHLTETGEARAQELIRAHRLWERYLVDREGVSLEAVHAEADRREHETTPEELERLDAELGHPAWDPHGDIIPDAGRRVPPPAGSPLAVCTPGRRLRILHVEDEPPVLFAQLVAMGLKPSIEVEVVERQPAYLRVKVNEDIFPLATATAERIHAVPVPILPVPLGELPVGVRAVVAEVKGGGKQQRRMLDMGLVPGAEVTVIRTAALGDPVEYRVKGTAIAMRRSDANNILVEKIRNE